MKKKNNKGFTLVELIIVIVILGILAAVAVPAYSGYISRANDAAIVAKLDAVKTAALAANAASGDISSMSLTSASIITATATTVDPGFVTNFNTYASGTASAQVSSNTITITLDPELSNYSNSSYSNGAYWTASAGWVTGTSTVPNP